MNPPSSSSTQRLPSLRDISDIKNVVIPFSKSILSKKTYVPNLFLSRNVPPKVKSEECTSAKNEPSLPKEVRRQRPEKKLLTPVETFAPNSDLSRGRLAFKSKSKIVSASIGIKRDNLDKISLKDIHSKLPTGKFDNFTSVAPQDLPVSLPFHPLTNAGGEKKIRSLITDILKPNGEESPLFLLKTPKYIPAVLDESKNPKISLKNYEKSGYKCTIHDLPEGQIGKLQVLKSGKLRLVLGECKFWLHPGVKINFKEELFVVKTDTESKSGEIINLGNVKERIIVVPDTVTKLNMYS